MMAIFCLFHRSGWAFRPVARGFDSRDVCAIISDPCGCVFHHLNSKGCVGRFGFGILRDWTIFKRFCVHKKMFR
jgi:hypothetical protein